MLGARTKQINVYGRRQQRIVNISENSQLALSAELISDTQTIPPSPKASAASRRKKEHVPRVQPGAASPARPSPVKRIRVKRPTKEHDIPTTGPQVHKKQPVVVESASRPPLECYNPNIPNSPTISRTTKKPIQRKVSGLKKAFNAYIDVDIIVLSDDGSIEKQERRVTRPDVQPNQLGNKSVGPPAPSAQEVHHLETDQESDHRPKPSRGKRKQVITIPTSDEEEEILPPWPKPEVSKPLGALQSKVLREASPPLRAKPIRPTESQPTKSTVPPRNSQPLPQTHRPSSPSLRSRQLTPIRRHVKSYPRAVDPSFPSAPIEIDDSLDLSDFELEEFDFSSPDIPIPKYLLPLLSECSQEGTGPHEFSAFIETFPYDPIVHTEDGIVEFRKIGEASYSEVFGIGDVVLKIIPLRNEDAGASCSRTLIDSPSPSDAKDVLKEMIVTKAMGEICPGFVRLLRTYVVRGKYPELLLRLWDEYAERKGSESIRPDGFSLSQTYAIIVLPNGGPDLESFAFPPSNKFCWRQACSIFWQVAKSLSKAEDLVSFEHRDLHWGQILVRQRDPSALGATKSSRVYLDDASHGVTATIIDLGLSRMNGDGNDALLWTAFEDEVFLGEGDYQFDIYRMMNNYIGQSWQQFKPLTNVMWLHYLALKLLKSKGLRAPVVRKTTNTARSQASVAERESYECLVEMEKLLRKSIAPYKDGAARKSGVKKADSLTSAADVAGYGMERCWIL